MNACRHSVPADRCPTCVGEQNAYDAAQRARAMRSAIRATRRTARAMRAGSVPSMATRRGRHASGAAINYYAG